MLARQPWQRAPWKLAQLQGSWSLEFSPSGIGMVSATRSASSSGCFGPLLKKDEGKISFRRSVQGLALSERRAEPGDRVQIFEKPQSLRRV